MRKLFEVLLLTGIILALVVSSVVVMAAIGDQPTIEALRDGEPVSVETEVQPLSEVESQVTSPQQDGSRSLSGLSVDEDDALEIALEYLQQNKASLSLTSNDLSDIEVTDRYVSEHNGLTHIYLNQQFNGISVYNATININVMADGSILSLGNNFISNLSQHINPVQPSLSAIEALQLAAKDLNLNLTKNVEVKETLGGPSNEVLFSNGGISLEDIPAKLVYQPLERGQVRLAWDLTIYELDAQNYWSIRVDAETGKILDKANWVVHDDWGTSQHDVDHSERKELVSPTPINLGNGSQFLTGPAKGEALDIALAYIRAHNAELGLSKADLTDYVVTDQYLSSHTGVTHIYLRQRINGIEIYGANININVAADGSIVNLGSHFISEASQRIAQDKVTLSAIDAVSFAAEALKLSQPEGLVVKQTLGSASQKVLLNDGNISLEDIPAKLIYQPTERGELRLAWDLAIYQLDAQNYWSVRIDAATGRLLDKANWVVHDDWGTPYGGHQDKGFSQGQATLNGVETVQTQQTRQANGLLAPDEYFVYPMPMESPIHLLPPEPDDPPLNEDHRALEVDPATTSASPYGWHDINGSTGAEYTITRGNNAHAYEDSGNNDTSVGNEPDGGGSLVFSFTLDLTQEPDTYQDAAIANLFYWNNIIHDVWYEYGFDEASGNFQENNYGNGGVGSDYVYAEGQDGSGSCNANFGTPADGSNPRMQMYVCGNATPSRDGDFDNNVIVHEYGHGISNRLTGGPSNVNCLNNSEQMGEGWSDWIALMMTIEPGDTGPDARGMGTYLFGQTSTGPGIRPAPYSTDMGVNAYTYGDIGGLVIPHGVGFLWATMLWDMNWNLIDEYGFDTDFYSGTGGNNLAMQLVADGMKLQPCSPGFVDGRDAILAADQVLTGGVNQCLIWDAFAKRGLGFSADQGSSGSTSDGTEAFDLPEICTQVLYISKMADPSPVGSGEVLTYTLVAQNNTTGTLTGVVITDIVPADTTYVPGSASDGGSESGGIVTFPGVTMVSGTAITRTFQVTVSSGLGSPQFFFDDMENGSGNWAISHGDGTLDWVYGTNNPYSGSYAWFSEDTSSVTDMYLTMANPIVINGNPILRVWHEYQTEPGYDGGVIEISTDGGTIWADLGSLATQSGYNSTISTCCSNPIGGRQAFSGISGGYVETLIDLSSYSGQSIHIRFRMATDSSASDNGWFVDDVEIIEEAGVYNTACVEANEGDFACASIQTLVIAPPTAPNAVDDTASTVENTPVVINVLANDIDINGDPLSVSNVGNASNGTTSTNGNTITYTPAGAFIGTDVFTYEASDGGFTDTALVTVTVMPNSPPNAVDDTAITIEDIPVTISVLNNDSDPDGTPLSVSNVGIPANGTASSNGITVVYTPTTAFTGTDVFTYEASDGDLTDTAVVTIEVYPAGTDGYFVYPPPMESPNHLIPPEPDDPPLDEDHRFLEINPATVNASPLGWHDTDGTAGAEFTITRGNNAHAYEDTGNNNGSIGNEPDAGPTLVFSYSLDLTQEPATYQEAAIVNLFYWNNVIHDVLYEYGFDEVSGNFQTNNYGNGGAGNDWVFAEGQDGSGSCNANFGTPADGSNPRMQMYTCGNATPSRDGDLDNNVIIHEYGHGVSNRLTGGPSNVNCLNNSEQMGEGWSDWLAVMMTIEEGDTGPDARGMGTYLFGEASTGPGIRPAPYSTDMGVNAYTYGDIGGLAVPHGVGFAWATMLWDMNWNLIDEYGFDPDLYNGTGGNNLAMQLVMDGMKIQPCSPGFVDGRDAILAADVALTGGANQCLLWDAFARRGLGFSADQGDSGSTSDGTEAFDLPEICTQVLYISKMADPSPATSTQPLTYTLVAQNNTTGTLTGVVITDIVPADTTYIPGSASDGGSESGGVVSFPGVTMASGTAITRTFQVTVDGGLGTIVYFSEDFEDGFGDWTMSGLWNEENEADTCGAIVTPFPSSSNGAYYGQDGDCDYNTGSQTIGELTLNVPIDLTGAGAATLSLWSYEQTECGGNCPYDNRIVQISTDGGSSWTTLGEGNTENSWYELSFDLTPYVGNNVLLRFQFDSDDDIQNAFFGWMIDDIRVLEEAVIFNTACVLANEGDFACDSIETPVSIPPSPPNAEDDTAFTLENTPVIIDVLSNDTDPNGDSLSVSYVSQPGNGTTSTDGNTVIYTPTTAFTGTDVFSYEISDGGFTDTALVTVTVQLNNPPHAVDDTDATNEDTSVVISVLDNDSDPENTPLIVSAVGTPGNGTTSTDGTTVTYIPTPDFNGTDVFSYTASDGGLTDTALVTVTVNAVNDAPVAVDDTDTTDEDTSISISVLDNDSDPEDDSLTISSVGTPGNGFATTDGSTVTYTPTADFNGEDTFSYTISDGASTDTALVTITINAISDAPIAVDDADSTILDTPVTISVLDNDSDPDGDNLTVSALGMPANGTATTDGTTVTYTPTTSFTGTEIFTYTASDGQLTDSAWITVTVTQINNAPVAVDDTDSTILDTPVTISVLDNDSDPDGDNLTVSDLGTPTNGTATTDGTTVIYTPTTAFTGTDVFSYTASDGDLTDSAWITVTVNATGTVNNAPVAVDDTATTNEDTAVTISVLDNDSDPDGDTLTVSAVGTPANGVAIVDGTTVTYTPTTAFTGTDVFSYTASDGDLTDSAWITITVHATGTTNNAPIAVDDTATTNEDTAVTISVLDNDSDPDGDTLTVSAVGTPANGVAIMDGTTVTYTPTTAFTGTDVFSYTASDGDLTDSAWITVTVNATEQTVFNVSLATDKAALSGNPNDTVTYTVWITNTGNVTDTFDISLNGNWTNSASLTNTGWLASGDSTNISVLVTVPANANNNDADTVTVTATSQGDATATDAVDLTTTAVVSTTGETYGVDLSPDDAQSGDVGTSVTYTIKITNTGSTTDTFDLTVSGNSGSTVLSIASVTLATGEMTEFAVVVTIPASANDGDMDTVTVTATSQTDNTVTDTTQLTTTAVGSGSQKIYLPVVMKAYPSS